MEIHNRVRALQPWPGTVAKFSGQTCKILKTAIANEHDERIEPGGILPSKGRLLVMCGDSRPLEVLSIQPESRKPVSGVDFANGSRIQPDEKFHSVMDNGPNA